MRVESPLVDAEAPPPPPPSPPRSSTSVTGARPPRLELAAQETTIGRYIARFRFDAPKPREAREAVGGGDFWWTRSPRYARSTSASPSSAASAASPRRPRASILDLEEDVEVSSRRGKEDRETGGELGRSLDSLPSLASSWSSSASLVEEADVAGVTVESRAEDAEAVIERVRRRLGWRSASYSLRDGRLPSRPAEYSSFTAAAGSRTPSPLYGSPVSRSHHGSEASGSSRVDSDSPVTPAALCVEEETASEVPNTAGSLPTNPSTIFASPTAVVERIPPEPSLSLELSASPDPEDIRLESLSMQLDPAIGPSSPALGSVDVSSLDSDSKESADSRARFSLSGDVPDLRFHGAASPGSNSSSAESKDAARPGSWTPDADQGGYDTGCSPDPVTPTTSLDDEDDTLRTPREATPPRATPPLPPTRSRFASTASRTSDGSPVEVPVPIQEEKEEESPHSAAEHVLNTLVGFVVHSWGEDEQSGDDTNREKHRPVSVVSDASQASEPARQAENDQPAVLNPEAQHHTVQAETEDGNTDALGSPANSTCPLKPASQVDDDAPLDLDEDYTQPNECDEMALLLVSRIAVLKAALRRLNDREGHHTPDNAAM